MTTECSPPPLCCPAQTTLVRSGECDFCPDTLVLLHLHLFKIKIYMIFPFLLLFLTVFLLHLSFTSMSASYFPSSSYTHSFSSASIPPPFSLVCHPSLYSSSIIFYSSASFSSSFSPPHSCSSSSSSTATPEQL